MRKTLLNTKAIISDALIAFLFAIIIILVIKVTIYPKIKYYTNIINSMAIKTNIKTKENTYLDTTTKKLKNYPKYGEVFATINIDSINVSANVTEGDSLKILKNSVGHFEGSYFPGEGGSIIFAAHNAQEFFMYIPNLKIGDKIKVSTTYGDFNYVVYNYQIIKDNETDKMPINKDEEILMLYTCYPVNQIGFKDHRYVVYARLVNN